MASEAGRKWDRELLAWSHTALAFLERTPGREGLRALGPIAVLPGRVLAGRILEVVRSACPF